MMEPRRPTTMRAWRKHAGSEQPVSLVYNNVPICKVANLKQQWDDVAVPKTPPNGFLCEVLAAGVCHSDHSMLVDKNPRPWFQDRFILVCFVDL